MLDKKIHIKLASKVNRIMKDCAYTLPDKKVDDVFLAHGYSPLTENNTYYYSMSKANQHIEELLELCKMLPILESGLKGTVGIIAYPDLIPNAVNPDVQLKNFVIADHFTNLLDITGVAILNELNKNGRKLVGSSINPKYKHLFSQSKSAPEPDEK